MAITWNEPLPPADYRGEGQILAEMRDKITALEARVVALESA